MPFTDIRGQKTAISILQRALATQKTAHAYLFGGVDGCGKRKTALALIEALFCGRQEGCTTCPSCRKIAAGQHPDLHFVEPDGAFIKIDQVRELQRVLSFRPFEAPKKACIINDAERLNAAAGNALLKTLEEPPGSAILILITANAGAMLPTILSRCQQLSFRGLGAETIEECLVAEGTDTDSARLAASIAGGSMKRARAFVEEAVLGERSGFLERVTSLTLREMTPLFAMAEELSGDRDKSLALLELLTSFLRDVLLLQAGNPSVINLDLLPLVEREACRGSQEESMAKIASVADARQAIQRNVNGRLALEVLFMRLARR